MIKLMYVLHFTLSDIFSITAIGSGLLATSVAWLLSCARKTQPTSRAKLLWLLAGRHPDSDLNDLLPAVGDRLWHRVDLFGNKEEI